MPRHSVRDQLAAHRPRRQRAFVSVSINWSSDWPGFQSLPSTVSCAWTCTWLSLSLRASASLTLRLLFGACVQAATGRDAWPVDPHAPGLNERAAVDVVVSPHSQSERLHDPARAPPSCHHGDCAPFYPPYCRGGHALARHHGDGDGGAGVWCLELPHPQGWPPLSCYTLLETQCSGRQR